MGRAESLVKLYFRKRETIYPTTGHSTSSMITKFEERFRKVLPYMSASGNQSKASLPKEGSGQSLRRF